MTGFGSRDPSPPSGEEPVDQRVLLQLWIHVVQIPAEGFTLQLLPEFHSSSDAEKHTDDISA